MPKHTGTTWNGSQGERLIGTAEVEFYSEEDALKCIGRSRWRELVVLGTRVKAELVGQDTGVLASPQETRQDAVQDNTKETNAGESALRTSENTDLPTENQYKALFTRIYGDLRHYTPDGPENDLKAMLEDDFGTVLSVTMKRTSTPTGDCLLGTAEATFATKEGLQKCIKASVGEYLFLHGRHLKATRIELPGSALE